MATKVIMPGMGEGIIEGTVAQWLKAEGETIEEFEPILEIETDKVTTEATAETTGTLLKIYVEEGETVPVGTVLALIGEPGEEAPTEAPAAQAVEEVPLEETTETAPETPEASAEPATRAGNGRENGGPRQEERDSELPFADWASPVVRRIAAEHDVDLSQVEGTGRGGRTTKKDILAYLERREEAEAREPTRAPAPAEKARPAPTPSAPRPAPAAGPGELLPLSNMRRRIAEHMVQSKHTSPHVTTVFEVDFSAVVAHREAHKEAFAQHGTRLTFTPYIVSATAQALREHPLVNSSWTDEGILLRQEINIGMATALEDGLIVPVIKDADHYNLRGLANLVNDLAERARNNRLQPAEVQGGTFSITNHGVSGSLFATPIINQPQTGILGIGKIEKRVKVVNDAIAIRPLAFVSFTFDHRVLDGASADYFVATFKEIIESWQ